MRIQILILGINKGLKKEQGCIIRFKTGSEAESFYIW